MHPKSQPLPGTTRDPKYPDSIPGTLANSDFHHAAVTTLRRQVETLFARRPDVYITTGLPLEDATGPLAAPDLMVAVGVSKEMRRSYHLGREGVVPAFVVEVCSDTSWEMDIGDSRLLCERLGVREYIVFDWEGIWLTPRLQGFRLIDGSYTSIGSTVDGRLFSSVLQIELQPDGGVLRLNPVGP